MITTIVIVAVLVLSIVGTAWLGFRSIMRFVRNNEEQTLDEAWDEAHLPGQRPK